MAKFFEFSYGVFRRRRAQMVLLDPFLGAPGGKDEGGWCRAQRQQIPESELISPHDATIFATKAPESADPACYFRLIDGFDHPESAQLALSLYNDEWRRKADYHRLNGTWTDGYQAYVLRKAARNRSVAKVEQHDGRLTGITVTMGRNLSLIVLAAALVLTSFVVFWLFFVAGNSPKMLLLVPLGMLLSGVSLGFIQMSARTTKYRAGDSAIVQQYSSLRSTKVTSYDARSVSEVRVHRIRGTPGREGSGASYEVCLRMGQPSIDILKGRNEAESVGIARIWADLLGVEIEFTSAAGPWHPKPLGRPSVCRIPEVWCWSFIRLIGEDLEHAPANLKM